MEAPPLMPTVECYLVPEVTSTRKTVYADLRHHSLEFHLRVPTNLPPHLKRQFHCVGDVRWWTEWEYGQRDYHWMTCRNAHGSQMERTPYGPPRFTLESSMLEPIVESLVDDPLQATLFESELRSYLVGAQELFLEVLTATPSKIESRGSAKKARAALLADYGPKWIKVEF